jgi:hypothetical protein
MSAYIYSKWKNSPAGSPVEFYSELDPNRYETRKVEVFANGQLGFASGTATTKGTRLGITPVPHISEILSQHEFEIKEISKKEFEVKWLEATRK